MVEETALNDMARWAERANALGGTTFGRAMVLAKPIPPGPFSVPLSPSATIKFQLAALTMNVLASAREIATSASRLWPEHHYLLASVGFRMLIELSGQLSWAERKVLAALSAGDIDRAADRMCKLTYGAKSPIPLLRGEVGPHPFINVMDFVRAEAEARPGTMEDYEFLCDLSHPSLAQTWMRLAGVSNRWSNATFASEVGSMFDRILTIAEGAVTSLESTGGRLFQVVVPGILSEILPEA